MGDNNEGQRHSTVPGSTSKLWDSSPESELAEGSGKFRSVQQTLVGIPPAPPSQPVSGPLSAEAKQFVNEQRVSETPPPPPGLRFIPRQHQSDTKPARVSQTPPHPGELQQEPPPLVADVTPNVTIVEPATPSAEPATPSAERSDVSNAAPSPALSAAPPPAAAPNATPRPAALSAAGDFEARTGASDEAPDSEVPTRRVSAPAVAAPTGLLSERPQVVEVVENPFAQKRSKGKWIAALLVAGALGGGWFLSQNDGGPPQEAAAVPRSDESDVSVKAQDKARATEASEKRVSRATSPPTAPSASKPKVSLPQLALRPEQSLKSCDDLMKAPFAEKQNPKMHMATGTWKKALSSLMRGKTDQAHKLMCYSASWHLGGPATYGLSEFLMKQGDYTQALKFAAMVPVTDENERRRAQELTGDIHAQQGQLAPARQAWLELFSAEEKEDVSEIAARYVKSGKATLDRKNYNLAERIFRRAVILDPKNADAAAGLAITLRKQDLDDAALDWAKFAVAQEPDSAFAQIELLEQLVEKKQLDAAREVLETTEKLAPKNPRVLALARRLKKD